MLLHAEHHFGGAGWTYIRRVSRIRSLDGAWDLGSRARRRAAASGDLDLCAADVELGRAAGVVNRERLDAEEVLSIGDALGDLVRVVG